MGKSKLEEREKMDMVAKFLRKFFTQYGELVIVDEIGDFLIVEVHQKGIRTYKRVYRLMR